MTHNTKWPKISIVTPSYDQGHFLEQTIKSVISQDYPNLEYIVIDGGSTDCSTDILNKYSGQISYWISEKDQGQSHAIEKGFKQATGKIYGWINSDDILLPNALHEIANHFVENPAHEFVHGDCVLIDEQGDLLRNHDAPNGVRQMTWTIEEAFQNWPQNWFAQQSTFWTASIWNRTGGLNQELHYVMDLDLWHRFAKETSLHRIPRQLAGYRIHKGAKCHRDFLPLMVEWMLLEGTYSREDLPSFWQKHLPTIKLLRQQNRTLQEQLRYNEQLVANYKNSRVLRTIQSLKRFFHLS